MSSSTGKKSHRKGKTGEREFANVIYRLTGGQVELQRNLNQCRTGGDDLTGYANFSIEVKRWKTASDALVRDWWSQCQSNAHKLKKVPVLAYRADHQGWKVAMHPNYHFPEKDVEGCLTMSADLFAKYLMDPENGLPDLTQRSA